MERPRFIGASYENAKCPCCWEPLGDVWKLSGSPKLPYHPECAGEMEGGLTNSVSALEKLVSDEKCGVIPADEIMKKEKLSVEDIWGGLLYASTVMNAFVGLYQGFDGQLSTLTLAPVVSGMFGGLICYGARICGHRSKHDHIGVPANIIVESAIISILSAVALFSCYGVARLSS